MKLNKKSYHKFQSIVRNAEGTITPFCGAHTFKLGEYLEHLVKWVQNYLSDNYRWSLKLADDLMVEIRDIMCNRLKRTPTEFKESCLWFYPNYRYD